MEGGQEQRRRFFGREQSRNRRPPSAPSGGATDQHRAGQPSGWAALSQMRQALRGDPSAAPVTARAERPGCAFRVRDVEAAIERDPKERSDDGQGSRNQPAGGYPRSAEQVSISQVSAWSSAPKHGAVVGQAYAVTSPESPPPVRRPRRRRCERLTVKMSIVVWLCARTISVGLP